jgi:hypothetical protein
MSTKTRRVRPGIVIGSKLKAPSGGKWISHWGDTLQTYEPEPDAKTQSIKAAIDAGVVAFETHEENILAVLRNAYECGAKSEPFDANRTWRHLTSLAFVHFWRKKLKQEAVLAADRSKRLRRIAKVLGEACRLFDEAKQDELINDLYSAWCDQNVKPDTVPDGPLEIVRFSDEFDKVVATLSTLKAAACKAREEVILRDGRPTGSILAPDIIAALADQFEEFTGLKLDKLTDKQFVEFAGTFLQAIGEARKVSKDYALEAIKYACKLKRKKERPVRE